MKFGWDLIMIMQTFISDNKALVITSYKELLSVDGIEQWHLDGLSMIKWIGASSKHGFSTLWCQVITRTNAYYVILIMRK